MGTRARASANPGRDGLKATATGVLVGLLLGPVVGALWLWVAPTPTAINTGGYIFLKDQNTSEYIAADGWFLIVGLIAGAVSGSVLFWLFRRRPIFAVIGMTLGAFAGSWIAWKVGVRLGPEPLEETASTVPEGGTIAGEIGLRAKVVLLGWPLGSVIAFVSLYAGLTRPEPASPASGPVGGPLPPEETPSPGVTATPPPPRRAAPIRPIARPGRAQPLGPAPAGNAAPGSTPAPASDPASSPNGNGRGPSVGADGRPGELGPGQGR